MRSSSFSHNDGVALFIDHASLSRSLSEEFTQVPEPRELAHATLRYAERFGPVVVARAYDDWTGDPSGAKAFRDAGIEPCLVLARRGPAALLALGADAQAHVCSHRAAGTVVLAAGDPLLAELVLRLRARARVVVVATDVELDEGIAAGAHEQLTVDEVLDGEDRQPRSNRSAVPTERVARSGSQAISTLHASEDFDADGYEWHRFVKLVHWLEARLPFVGVGYLIKKAMNYDNVGTSDMRVKQAIFQHAQERGLVEVYYKDNIEEDGDPVAACQLLRDNTDVQDALEGFDAEDDGY